MKILSILLVFICTNLLFAQSYSGGTGTSGNPYQIDNLTDLRYLSENTGEWSKYFIQTADISFAASDFDSGGDFYNTGEGFIPIGNVTTQFTGSYDGQGHTISNMKINRSSDCVGFFGYTNSASNVSNLGIVSCNISGGNNTGGLIGANSSTSVSNCFVTGSVSGGSPAGGLAGQVSNNSQISNCYSRASVSGWMNAGGLVGSNSSSTISKCYSTGGVGGGLIGLGGLVGSNTGTVTDSFWDIQTSGKTTSSGGVGKTTEDMKSYEIYYLVGWDFIDETDNGTSNYWGLNAAENDGYPFLAWQNYTNSIPLTVVINSITNLTSSALTANGDLVKLGSGSVTEHGFCWSTSENPTITDSKIENGSTSATGTFSSNISGLETATTYYLKAFATDAEGTKYSAQKSFSTLPGGGGDGTSNNPYVISELRDLQWIMNNSDQWDKHFIQIVDIDASATSGWDGGKGFLPIGNFTTQFTGCYDGQGHTISNLKINRPSTDYIGIFGYINGSSAISNLGIVNCDITGNMFTGGLIGCSVDSQIDKCYVTGNIQGRDYLGGFIGRNWMATITNSYADVTVDGNTIKGGFVGENNSTISNCYSTSVINGNGTIGGIVASGGGTVSNTFWDTETSGTTISVGGTGKTTAEMKDITTYLNAGWDFVEETDNGTDDIWGIDTGLNNGYPYLKWQFPNNAPTVDPTPYISINTGGNVDEGGTFTFNDLCLKASDADGPSYSLTYNVTQEPAHGSLTKNGALLKVDETTTVSFTQNDIANGKVTYTHDGSEANEDFFKFTVTDADGNSSDEETFTIKINGVNDSPVFTGSPEFTINEDESFSIMINSLYSYVNDPDDPDSLLTFTIDKTCHNITLTNENSCCNICGIENWFGITELKLTVSDSSTTIDTTISLTVLPVNDYPTINGLPASLSITNGDVEAIDLAGQAEDVETPDSLLVWSFNCSPDSLNIYYNAETEIVSCSAKGSFEGEVDLTVTVTDEDGGIDETAIAITVTPDPTGINELSGIPKEYELSQNYPNPFNPSTVIRYGIPAVGDAYNASKNVTLKIYDILGNLIATLQDGPQSPGFYERTWNLSDRQAGASNISSGIYFYVLKAGRFVMSRKMILLK